MLKSSLCYIHVQMNRYIFSLFQFVKDCGKYVISAFYKFFWENVQIDPPTF